MGELLVHSVAQGHGQGDFEATSEMDWNNELTVAVVESSPEEAENIDLFSALEDHLDEVKPLAANERSTLCPDSRNPGYGGG